MTVKEMHIGIDIGLQNIRSNLFDTLLPEEKDWILNEVTLDFISLRYDKNSNPAGLRFEDNKKRLNDIQKLITPLSGVSFYRLNDECSFALLPANYYEDINIEVGTLNLCKNNNDATEKVYKYYTIIPFANSRNTLYLNFKIIANNLINPLYDINNFSDYKSSLKGEEERFYIIRNILDYVNSNTTLTKVQVYWEYFNEVYYPNSFIFVSTENNVKIDVYYNDDKLTYNTSFFEFICTTSNDRYNKVPVRLVDEEHRPNILNYSFSKSTPTSPVISIKRNIIYVYHKGFSVDKLYMEYIRLPRSINYITEQTCEINENRHKDIVNLAVKRIAGLSLQENYKGIIAETPISTTT